MLAVIFECFGLFFLTKGDIYTDKTCYLEQIQMSDCNKQKDTQAETCK